MIFSLAGPWEKGEFIQIVPTEALLTLESCQECFLEQYKGSHSGAGFVPLEDEEVGPIAEYIVSALAG